MVRKRKLSKSKSVEIGSVLSTSTTVGKKQKSRLNISKKRSTSRKISDDRRKLWSGRYTYRATSLEENLLYCKRFKESDGFDMPSFPGLTRFGIKSCPRDFVSEEKFKTFATGAIQNFKTTVDPDANPRFPKMVNACYKIAGTKVDYYITFKAKDAADNDKEKIYQALISTNRGSLMVQFSRLKPTPAPALAL